MFKSPYRSEEPDPGFRLAAQSLGFASTLVIELGAAATSAGIAVKRVEEDAQNSWAAGERLIAAEEHAETLRRLLCFAQAKLAWEKRNGWQAKIETHGGRGRPRPWIEDPKLWEKLFQRSQSPTL